MKYFATFLLMSFSLACFAKGEITIKGRITDYKDSLLIYSYGIRGYEAKHISKKVPVTKDGSFSFTINDINEPTIVRLLEPKALERLKVQTPRGLDFVMTRNIEVIASPSKTYTVSAQFKSPYAARVDGDEINATYSAARKTFFPLNEAFEQASWRHLCNKHAQPFDSIRFNASATTVDSLQNALLSMKMKWIEKHPQNMVSAILLSDIQYTTNVESLSKLYSIISKNVRSSCFLSGMDVKIRSMKSIVVGGKPFNFTGTLYNGSHFNLASLKGHWYILEFWGSWCGPCRKSHPELIDIYSKFHSKGLEIISVASDNSEEKWRAAVAADGVGGWNQIRSSKENDIVGLFNISGFPTKIIVDPNGVIKSIHLGAPYGALTKEISEIFNQ